MKNMISRTAVLLAFVSLVACGGNPASPDRENQIPRVDGVYTGPLTTFRVDGVNYSGVTMRIAVVQAGSQITANGAFIVDGQSFPIPAATGNISATGSISEGPSSGDAGNCGFMTNGYVSLTFSGNTAQFTMTANTSFCGQMELAGLLRK
jgi:hypothetical protein